MEKSASVLNPALLSRIIAKHCEDCLAGYKRCCTQAKKKKKKGSNSDFVWMRLFYWMEGSNWIMYCKIKPWIFEEKNHQISCKIFWNSRRVRGSSPDQISLNCFLAPPKAITAICILGSGSNLLSVHFLNVTLGMLRNMFTVKHMSIIAVFNETTYSVLRKEGLIPRCYPVLMPATYIVVLLVVV